GLVRGGPDRPGGGAPGGGVRNAHPLHRPPPAAGLRATYRRSAGGALAPAAGERRAVAARAFGPGDEGHHERGHAATHEAGRHPHQHRARRPDREEALALALEQGRLGAAGLDVYLEEPRIHPRLVAAPRTVLLPHLGSATLEARRQMAAIALANVQAVLAGDQPLTAVFG